MPSKAIAADPASSSALGAEDEDLKPPGSGRRKRRSTGSVGAVSESYNPTDALSTDLYIEVCKLLDPAKTALATKQRRASRRKLADIGWDVEVGYADDDETGLQIVRLRGTCHDLPLRLDIVAELEPGSGSTASSATINQLQLHVSAFVQLEIGTLIDQCCQRIALSHLLAGVDSYASVCERRREILASLTSAFPTLAHPHEGGIIFRNERAAELVLTFNVQPERLPDDHDNFIPVCAPQLHLVPRVPPSVALDDSTAAMLASIPSAFIDLLREGRPLVDAVSFFVLSMFAASLRLSS